MSYKIEVKQVDNNVTVDISGGGGIARHFDINIDKDGLHITGNDNLSATWDSSDKISIDTVV